MATNPTEFLLDKAPVFHTAPSHWPAAPKQHRSRAPEFYGFVALTSTYLAYTLYILWAITPDKYIKKTGITWYPNREWALLIPSWSVVLAILTYITYSAIAIQGAPDFDEINSVTDHRVSLPAPGHGTSDAYIACAAQPDPIPEIYDIPIGLVNRVLYRNTAHPSPFVKEE